MNPFREKQLDEFTVADCEQYIEHYPYGERISDVKSHLRTLRKQSNVRSGVPQQQPNTFALSKKDCEYVEDKHNPVKRPSHVEVNKKKHNTKKKIAWEVWAKNIIGVIVLVFAIFISIEVMKNNLPKSAWVGTLAGSSAILKWCGWFD